MTLAPRFQSALALLSLFALLGAWTPHVHPATETSGARHETERADESVSSDDHHHQHSSESALESEPCLACRSDAPDDKPLAHCVDFAFEEGTGSEIAAAEFSTGPRIPYGLPLTRAPPADLPV